MAKEKSVADRPWLAEMFQVGIYKRNQGRIARQATFFAIAIVIAVGCYSLSNWLSEKEAYIQFGVPLAIGAVGCWLTYRAVNVPSFADFLISVEAEMTKVKWPTREELLKASFVVLLFILIMAIVLFGFDLFWQWFFMLLNVIPEPAKPTG